MRPFTTKRITLYVYETHFLLQKFSGIVQKKGLKKTVFVKLNTFFKQPEVSSAGFLILFYEAVDCLRPFLELKSYPGGKVSHIPFEVSYKRQCFLAIKFLLEFSKSQSQTKKCSVYESLFHEIKTTLKFEGGSLKRKQLQYKTLFQNKNKLFWRNKMRPAKEVLHNQIRYKNDLGSFFYKNLKKLFLIKLVFFKRFVLTGMVETVDTLDLGSIY
jgi:ribosomal protein S7